MKVAAAYYYKAIVRKLVTNTHRNFRHHRRSFFTVVYQFSLNSLARLAGTLS